ncbi:MAG: glycosyltransferase, partial [Bacteroidetes bacterium]|nr:glycosyltransferase [Bacteroidota bacterium]
MIQQVGHGPEFPLVSVVVPTYQHVAYIEDCLNGILLQETTFPVEILIGEDESSDGTREICQRIAAAHPDRIRLFLRSRKDVMH